MVKIFIYLAASSSLSQLKSVSDPITSVSPASTACLAAKASGDAKNESCFFSGSVQYPLGLTL